MPEQVTMIPFSDGKNHLIQLNVDGNVFATYKLFEGRDCIAITDKAVKELKSFLYSHAVKVLYHEKS